ncbi:MAG: UMP kinase [Candidatus Nomurabacteria bacterium]|nr:MAG: UMP kinase [Candidatus Nomurabacteria bacterium]
MKKQPTQPVSIISLGGSLIVPDEIDVTFLKKFRQLILSFVRQGQRFVIITGGGKTNKRYNEAARKLATVKAVDLDWIGIATTKVHAHLLRSIFGAYANTTLIDNPEKPPKMLRPILLGGGYVPGHSTDMDAVQMAIALGATRILNLSDIPYVYTKDPKKYKDAKALGQVNWKEYRKIIPKKWTPRLSSPFDPRASALAQKHGLEVDILQGKRLEQVKLALQGKAFHGTRIFT